MVAGSESDRGRLTKARPRWFATGSASVFGLVYAAMGGLFQDVAVMLIGAMAIISALTAAVVFRGFGDRGS